MAQSAGSSSRGPGLNFPTHTTAHNVHGYQPPSPPPPPPTRAQWYTLIIPAVRAGEGKRIKSSRSLFIWAHRKVLTTITELNHNLFILTVLFYMLFFFLTRRERRNENKRRGDKKNEKGEWKKRIKKKNRSKMLIMQRSTSKYFDVNSQRNQERRTSDLIKQRYFEMLN